MGVVISRFDVYLVRLDPTEGYAIQKTRPCLVISPDEMNRHIGTVIVAPMTTRGRPYPMRARALFQGKRGLVVLDQIRTVDKARLEQRLGRIVEATAGEVLAALAELFAP